MKETIDYEMFQDFVKDYKLDEYGGIQLLRILLDRILNKEELDKPTNDKFINLYIKNYKEVS